MAWSASKQFVRRRWDRKMLKSCERTIYFICSWLASSYHQIHGLRLEMIRQFIDIHDTAVHCKRLLKQTPIQVMIIFDCTYFLDNRSSSFPYEWDISLGVFTEFISLIFKHRRCVDMICEALPAVDSFSCDQPFGENCWAIPNLHRDHHQM